MDKKIKYALFFIILAAIACLTPLNVQAACSDEQELFTEGSAYPPNVLIILDNSQSMDENFTGGAVAPWKTNSKLVEAKRAMMSIIAKYKDTMQIGLMTYKLPTSGLSTEYTHNSVYFGSYQLKSYCPNPPASCQEYCSTGDATAKTACNTACTTANPSFDIDYFPDTIITASTGTKRAKYCNLTWPKRYSIPNPLDLSHPIYYKQMLPYYQSSLLTTEYRYATTYGTGESTGPGVQVPGVSYQRYLSKTGDSDALSGYASPSGSTFQTSPSDSDVALGYLNFGQRRYSYGIGKTFYSASSPGPGFLRLKCDYTGTATAHANDLYAKLAMYENDETNYIGNCSATNKNTCNYIVNAGLTPIAGTMQSAIDYLKGVLDKNNSAYSSTQDSPILSNCQKNYIILVTDGLPSVDESGNPNAAVNLIPKVLEKIDTLRKLDVGIRSGSTTTTYTFNVLTFVVGMGLTDDAKTQLDVMAVHGGTSSSDGHAIYADDVGSIYTVLDNIMTNITARTYSFSASSISSSRTADENYLYEATFIPTSATPYWRGQLKKWALGTDGSMTTTVWDAGEVLKNRNPATRTIKTYINGSMVDFKSSDIDTSTPVPYQYLKYAQDTTSPTVVSNQTTGNKVIKYIRGYTTDPVDSTALKPSPYKLGDIFHSSPITLGTPSLLWTDLADSANAFNDYRTAHQRNSSDGTRMVITGANDGQFHAFLTSDGSEFWSFIPPNLLPKLQDIYHVSTTSSLEHQFFVDGAVVATDAWLPATYDDGDPKTASDWKTLVTFTVGRNDCDYTTTSKAAVRQSTKYWGKTGTKCSALNTAGTALDIQETYDANHLDYCGYWAFDFTSAPGSPPSLLWTLSPGSLAQYLGEPWSSISPGRVKVNGVEKWVGVIGGGLNADTAPGDKRGKGIIVIDLKTGIPIWSYTYADNANMEYSIPSKVASVDTDNDGYLDRAYVGDVKGNMWQIKFCTKADYTSDANCDLSSWKGGLLFDKASGSDKYPFYYPPAVAWDRAGDLWIYGVTGDVKDPNGSGPAAWIYGVKPLLCVDTSGNPSACARADLENITSWHNQYCDSTKLMGWSMNLAGSSEKALAAPWVFNSVLYFTTFVPKGSSSSDCTKTGTSSLYAISVETGTSSLTCTAGKGLTDIDGSRSVTIGAGIASGGTISYGPGASTPNIFVTISGAGGQEGGTLMSDFIPPSPATRTNLIYWKDKRLE